MTRVHVHQPSNDKTPYNTVKQVSPELATRWLEGNTHNRTLKQWLVDRFVRDMQADRWQLTHQGIAFDVDEVLIDGQHRLWAVVLSGKTVPMRVFFNEPIETMMAVDTGVSRSNFDVLHLNGEVGEITPIHLATLRAMLAGASSHGPRLTVSEESQQMAKHADAINFGMKHLAFCRFRGVATATIRGIIARAYYAADHAKLIHFCDILKTGTSGDEEDLPILLLWQFLLSNANAGKAEAVRRIRYAKAERALLAYLRGDRIAHLRAVGSELFPLPEEVVRETVA
jgi:hypothetical protein